MVNPPVLSSALGIEAVTWFGEPSPQRRPSPETLVARIEHLERELEGARREPRRLHDLLSAAQRARRVAEQRAHAEHALRMESEELLLRRTDEADQVAAAARAPRDRAERRAAQAESLAAGLERRATRAESLAAGLERLLRDDTARCAHVYDAVQGLRRELDAVRSATAAHVLVGAVEPDRLTAALTRLREAAPPQGSREDRPARGNADPARPWRAALHRLTRRLA